MRNPDDVLTLKEAAEYAHITKQAVYVALKKKKLEAFKVKNRWFITREKIDEYRLNKYNRHSRRKDGDLIYDIEEGRFSIHDLSKIMSLNPNEGGLGKRIPVQRLYYLVRTGQLKSHKVGCSIVIYKEDILDLVKRKYTDNDKQLRIL